MNILETINVEDNEVKRLREIAHKAVNQSAKLIDLARSLQQENFQLKDELNTIEAQIELLEKARANAVHEGDMTHDEEAALIHRNIELEQEVAKLNKSIGLRAKAHKETIDELFELTAKYDQLLKEHERIPKLIRRIYR